MTAGYSDYLDADRVVDELLRPLGSVRLLSGRNLVRFNDLLTVNIRIVRNGKSWTDVAPSYLDWVDFYIYAMDCHDRYYVFPDHFMQRVASASNVGRRDGRPNFDIYTWLHEIVPSGHLEAAQRIEAFFRNRDALLDGSSTEMRLASCPNPLTVDGGIQPTDMSIVPSD